MKKQGVQILLIVMIIFLCILIGFFLGRNIGKSPIHISKVPESTSPSNATISGDKININTADIDQLQKIPGVGSVIAQRIVDYREANGPFRSVSELTNVDGIGISRLEQIMDYITV
jgi:competence protein ComEA